MYGPELAAIHDAGFTDVAHAAARELMDHVTPPGRVLDLGCGGGTLSQAVSEGGFDAWGIDVSPAMVDRARQRVPEGVFTVADVLEASLPPAVAAAAVGEVFCYAARRPEDLVPVWRRIHGALAPGGVLLFDVAARGRAPEPTRAVRQGRDWRVEATAHEEEGFLVRSIHVVVETPGGPRRATEVHRLLLLEPAWVVQTLGAIGFDVEPLGAYDDFALQEGWDAFLARR